jgi:hypothetical protein
MNRGTAAKQKKNENLAAARKIAQYVPAPSRKSLLVKIGNKYLKPGNFESSAQYASFPKRIWGILKNEGKSQLVKAPRVQHPKGAGPAPALSRYLLENNGWRNTKPNQPNRNNAKAEQNSGNLSNNNANENSARHSIYNPATRDQMKKIISKVIPLAALGPSVEMGNTKAVSFIRGLTQTLKGITQASTMASYSGTVLETASFDMGAVAAGMKVMYFSKDLKGSLSNLPRTGPPVVILKARFTFARSVKSNTELITERGKHIWLPIIRAGSDNPYTDGEGGHELQELPVPFGSGMPANVNSWLPGPRGGPVARHGAKIYYATPFNKLRVKKGKKLYKGYTAVEPDILIWVPAENKIKIVELKIGPGKAEPTPGEAFQLLKAYRSIEMSMERVNRRPTIEMYFVPWFYSKIRAGKAPNFTPLNKGNTRTGHEITKDIHRYFPGGIRVLDTREKVGNSLGIDAEVANIVLDAVRALDFDEAYIILKHIKTHKLFFTGYSENSINKVLKAAGNANPAHGREQAAVFRVQPGGQAYSARLANFKTSRPHTRRPPPRWDTKARKVVDQLIQYGELEARNKANGRYYVPGTLKGSRLPGRVPNIASANSSASNVHRRSPSSRPGAIDELWKRFYELNKIIKNNSRTNIPPQLKRWWLQYHYRKVNNSSEKSKLAGIYSTWAGSKSPKTWLTILKTGGLNSPQAQAAFKRVYGNARGASIYANAKRTSPARRPSSASSMGNNGGAANLFGRN